MHYQICPICMSYTLSHPVLIGYNKCPTCAFTYKIKDFKQIKDDIIKKRKNNQ